VEHATEPLACICTSVSFGRSTVHCAKPAWKMTMMQCLCLVVSFSIH